MAVVKKRGDKWIYRVRYIDPVTGKQKEKSKTFNTKKEAELAAAEIERKIYLGETESVQKGDMKFVDWVEEYWEIYAPTVRETTRRTRRGRLDKHLLPALGHYRLNKLTRAIYIKFINEKLETMAESTVKGIHGLMMVVMNKAVQHDIIIKNKLTGVPIRKEEVDEDNDIAFLAKDRLEVFLNASKNLIYYESFPLFFLSRTGLRKGELLGLTWDDIDFEKKTVSITKSRNSNGVYPPKTKKSKRVIKIDNAVVHELKKWENEQKKHKLAAGVAYQKNNYLITNEYGVPFTEWRLNQIIEKICSRLQIPRFGPHALRHTHAVMLLESGASIKFVSERLGHTTLEMTMRYLHISEQYEDANIDRLESYLDSKTL